MSRLKRVSLTEAQQRQLEARLSQATPREQRRIQAVQLYHQGHSAAEVATTLPASLKAVYTWLHCYQARGADGLQGARRPRKVDDHYRQILTNLLNECPGPWTGKALRAAMAERTGVSISTVYLIQILKQMGCDRGWMLVKSPEGSIARN